MSDTPRTDAEANGGNSMGVLMGNGLRYALVQSEFARQLERELNAANERIKRLEEESESRWNLAQSAIGSCAEMSSRIKQLREAGNDLVWWFCQGEPSQLSPTQSAALKRWRDLRGRRSP